MIINTGTNTKLDPPEYTAPTSTGSTGATSADQVGGALGTTLDSSATAVRSSAVAVPSSVPAGLEQAYRDVTTGTSSVFDYFIQVISHLQKNVFRPATEAAKEEMERLNEAQKDLNRLSVLLKGFVNQFGTSPNDDTLGKKIGTLTENDKARIYEVNQLIKSLGLSEEFAVEGSSGYTAAPLGSEKAIQLEAIGRAMESTLFSAQELYPTSRTGQAAALVVVNKLLPSALDVPLPATSESSFITSASAGQVEDTWSQMLAPATLDQRIDAAALTWFNKDAALDPSLVDGTQAHKAAMIKAVGADLNLATASTFGKAYDQVAPQLAIVRQEEADKFVAGGISTSTKGETLYALDKRTDAAKDNNSSDLDQARTRLKANNDMDNTLNQVLDQVISTLTKLVNTVTQNM